MGVNEQNSNALMRRACVFSRAFIALIFLSAGLMQLLMSVNELKQIMPWVEYHPLWFTYMIGVVDLAGGIGLLVPGILRSGPAIVKYAALGCASKQALAILFHLTDGDVRVIPLNILLLVLSAFLIRTYMGNKPQCFNSGSVA